jgi:ferredoxin-fold anticodon binding domain-containing protein
MSYSQLLIAFLAVTLTSGSLNAADGATPVHVVQGVIEKIEKDSIVLKPRASSGKFEKNMILKLTGTSRLSVVSTQKRGEATVFVQKDLDSKQLAEKQSIAVIFAKNGDDNVILTGVHHVE